MNVGASNRESRQVQSWGLILRSKVLLFGFDGTGDENRRLLGHGTPIGMASRARANRLKMSA